MARWTYANVLNVAPDARKLWQFEPKGDQFALAREYVARNGETIPGKLAGKDWHSLWQPKLNIAWLPIDKVYLRVLQLPAADFSETLSMVELQLEKLSPLPVAQIVWTVEVLPKRTEDNLQSAIIVIVPRNLVEEFLGQLEGQNYMADRLETPLLDQLLATQINEDGVWFYPGETDNSPCLVAWWYGGILRHVTLLSWSAGSETDRLKEQVAQMAWAGELEGWLNTPPRWHLIADADRATAWEPVLREIANETVQVIPPVPPPQLAALSAKRAARANTAANLLPAEYTARYRQQFVDRLWMRGLFGIIVLYLVGVVIYFSALQVLNFRLYKVQKEINGLSLQYTNAIQLKERVRVLEEQANLKFAALDCWKIVAKDLPAELTLTSMNFQKGERLMISGSVAQENVSKATDFWEAMSKETINGIPLELDRLVTPPSRPGPNGVPTIYWNFVCYLKKGGK